MLNATSLFPYGIRSGVGKPALACAVLAEASLRTRSGPDARRDPFDFGLSVPGRAPPALRGLPPRDAAPAIPPPEFVTSPFPGFRLGACSSRNARQSAADFVYRRAA